MFYEMEGSERQTYRKRGRKRGKEKECSEGLFDTDTREKERRGEGEKSLFFVADGILWGFTDGVILDIV